MQVHSSLLSLHTQAVRIGYRSGELAAKAGSWVDALEKAHRASRRLRLLDSRQLLRFIQALAAPTVRSIEPFALLR